MATMNKKLRLLLLGALLIVLSPGLMLLYFISSKNESAIDGIEAGAMRGFVVLDEKQIVVKRDGYIHRWVPGAELEELFWLPGTDIPILSRLVASTSGTGLLSGFGESWIATYDTGEGRIVGGDLPVPVRVSNVVGGRAIVAADDFLYEWDVDNPEEWRPISARGTLPDNHRQYWMLSYDGSRVLTDLYFIKGSSGARAYAVQIWDSQETNGEEPLAEIELDAEPWDGVFLDENRAVISLPDRIAIWNIQNSSVEYFDSPNAFNKVHELPDGTIVASGDREADERFLDMHFSDTYASVTRFFDPVSMTEIRSIEHVEIIEIAPLTEDTVLVELAREPVEDRGYGRRLEIWDPQTLVDHLDAERDR